MKPAHPEPNGFTLLEMLVVLAVFGLLMLAVTEGIRFAGTASTIATKSVVWMNQIEPADRAIRNMIEQIRPAETLEVTPPINGNAENLSFKTELSDPSLDLGHSQAQVTLRLNDKHALVAFTQPAPHAEWVGDPAPVRETVLLDHLDSVTFGYWDGTKWMDQWHSQAMPMLIRVSLHFPEDDPRHWPEIIVSPLRETLP